MFRTTQVRADDKIQQERFHLKLNTLSRSHWGCVGQDCLVDCALGRIIRIIPKVGLRWSWSSLRLPYHYYHHIKSSYLSSVCFTAEGFVVVTWVAH